MRVPVEKRRRALVNKLNVDDEARFLNSCKAIHTKNCLKQKRSITKKNSYTIQVATVHRTKHDDKK